MMQRYNFSAILVIILVILFFTSTVISGTLKDNSFTTPNPTNQTIPNDYFKPWSNWGRDKNHNRIDDLIDDLFLNETNDSINIYINYQTRPTKEDMIRLKAMKINISYKAKYIPTICAREVPINKIEEIRSLPNIAMIEQQPYLTKTLDVSAGSIKARESEIYSPDTAWELGYTGRDITIAILDTGVDDRHEALTNKYVAGYDCTLRVPRETNPDDEDGHGTHCAGIAMGTGGEEGQYIGIAPNAKLVDVKVLNDIGLTPGDQIVQGIEFCINQKEDYDIQVLSISIGEFFTGNDDGSGTHARLVDSAAEAGLVMIVAGGNDGPNNNGFSSLAAADGAITVGAIDEKETVRRNDDEIASFSNRGPRANDGDLDEIDELKPDVVAPGVGIMSALYSNTQIGLITGYHRMSGTSMACPHVAGLAALLLEANHNLSPEKIKQIIQDTAESRGHPSYSDIDPKYNVDYGWGIVDAYEAVKKVLGEDYQTIEVISHDMFDQVYNIVTVYGSASVNKGRIELVEYRINENPWTQADGKEDWSFNWDTRTVNNGYQNIKLRSFDGIEYSKDFDLTLNVVNIGATTLEPLNGSTIKGTLLVKGTSFGKDVKRVLIKIGDLSWDQVEPTAGINNYTTWEYSWNSKELKDGYYKISVKADNAKWQSLPTNIEVKVRNKKTQAAGFLPGFEWFLFLISLLIITIFKLKIVIRRK